MEPLFWRAGDSVRALDGSLCDLRQRPRKYHTSGEGNDVRDTRGIGIPGMFLMRLCSKGGLLTRRCLRLSLGLLRARRGGGPSTFWADSRDEGRAYLPGPPLAATGRRVCGLQGAPACAHSLVCTTWPNYPEQHP